MYQLGFLFPVNAIFCLLRAHREERKESPVSESAFYSWQNAKVTEIHQILGGFGWMVDLVLF